MINLIVGQPGKGKTKDLIQHANEGLANAKGSYIFIGQSNDCMLELHHDIRYINLSEYPVDSSSEFIGFLHGLTSTNYDIERIYLDDMTNLYVMSDDELCTWLQRIKALADKNDILFEISISITDQIPNCLAPYM